MSIKHKIGMKLKIMFGKEKISNDLYKKGIVYIFLAADYGNLGDIAITYAQRKFLEKTFKNYNIVEIPLNKTLVMLKNIKKHIRRHDIVTIVGGGNMGNIYEYYEELRRLVISSFRRNFVISFPQTIDFTDDKKGVRSLNKTKRVINKHKNIMIIARENKSYERMKKEFNCKIELFPDIVFSLKNNIEFNGIGNREKIGVCFRDDKENNINIIKCKKEILKKLNNYDSFSTYIGDNFEYENRYEILFNLLKKIASYKFIITDRLHALIFSYLTDTPCFFFDNSNNKISQTYKTWLLNDKNIIELDKKNYMLDFDKKIDKTVKQCNLDMEFDKLEKTILNNINNR